MTRFFSFLSEIIRILLLWFLFMYAVHFLVHELFTFPLSDTSDLLLTFSMYLAFFILYRNKLQFAGWYKSTRNTPLPRYVTISITATSILSFLLALWISYIDLTFA